MYNQERMRGVFWACADLLGIRKRGHDGQPRMLAEALVDMLLEIEEFLTGRSGNSTVLRDCRANMVTVENNATQQAFVEVSA